jgi:glycosyl hydrolase family 5
MSRPFAASDFSASALGGPISFKNGSFVDSLGRTLSLRGLNISGASKLPTKPNGLSHLTEGFFEHRTVTFVGRPFPLEEAPLHFRRLQAWGLPVVRLLVTWESIGHAGPDPSQHLDLEYISYLRALIELMSDYGIVCFICAHQDVWSRYSGGSGAPGWTFEVAGLNVEAFTDTGAAYIHGQDEKRRETTEVNEKEPRGPFVWPSGYQKLAASTMATLFWAGEALAPKLMCARPWNAGPDTVTEHEVSIQAFLQDAFIEAFGRLADEVAGLDACLGFEPLNEPHRGLVNLHGFHGWNYDTDLHIGHYPTLLQSLALASGYSQDVDYYVKSWPFPTRVSHRSRVDPKGRSAWLSAGHDANHGMGKCVWRAHGVWDWDEATKTPQVLQDDYFETDHRPGRAGVKLEWYRDCYAPFLKRFSDRVSRRSSSTWCFVEPIPNEFMPRWPGAGDVLPATKSRPQQIAIDTQRPRNFIFAPHFYDLNVLFAKYHSWMSVNVQGLSRGMFVLKALYFGAQGLRENYRLQISNILRHGRESLGLGVPALIGEVGIPFDLNDKSAFATGDYHKQRELMHALIGAMEDNFVGFTLWNYNPHNRMEYGDGWNMEDFSIINGDERSPESQLLPDHHNSEHEDNELYRGGRVLDVVIRPYAVKTAGQPTRSAWDPRTLRFDLEWSSPDSGLENGLLTRTTEIFLPQYHYAKHDLQIQLSDGDWSLDLDRHTLRVQHDAGTAHHRLVVQLARVEDHLATRQQQGRDITPSFPFNLMPSKLAAFHLEGTQLILVAFVPVLTALAAMAGLS